MPTLSDDVKTARAAVKSAQEALDNWEIDTDSREFIDAYDSMLDEVAGEFMGYSASRILKEVDPTAYRCGASDYADGLVKESFREYTDLQRELEEAEEELNELETEEEAELEKERDRAMEAEEET